MNEFAHQPIRNVCSGFIAFSMGMMAVAANADDTTTNSVYRGHRSDVKDLAYSPDGSRIASLAGDEVRLWETATATLVSRIPASNAVAIAFHPDGKRLAVAASKTVTIYNIDETVLLTVTAVEPRGNFPFPPTVLAVAFSPDGRQLATAGTRPEVGGPHGLPGGIVKIWDVDSGREQKQFKCSTPANAVAFRGDGQYLAIGTDGAGGELPESGEVQLSELATGQVRQLPARSGVTPGDNRCSIGDVVFSPDGTQVAAACADSIVRLWDVKTGRETFSLRGHRHRVRCVAFHPNGNRLATAGDDHTIRLWDVKSGQQIKSLPGHTRTVSALVFSPDGTRLASASSAGSNLSPAIAGLIDPDVPRSDVTAQAGDKVGEFRIWKLEN